MDSSVAGLIGMGLCAVGFNGAGLGIAFIFGKTIETVGRQPGEQADHIATENEKKQRGNEGEKFPFFLADEIIHQPS